MDNKLKNIGCAVGLLLLLLPVVFGVIAIKLMALETDYTEKDWFKYYFFTPDELKQAPRLTNDYIIGIRAQDGPSPGTATIEFYGTQDTQTLKRYLASLGYYPVIDDFSREVWYSADNELSAQVVAGGENSVSLTIFDVGAPLSIREARENALRQPAAE